jgi:ParB-like chromosome segregation protein Spo0J
MTMKTKQKLLSIPIKDLLPHPMNPNQMSDQAFKKLVAHIERSGNYEPIIVRSHPTKKGLFQCLNGHHRAKALQQLGYDSADCIAWDVDDKQALILLTTLNRLTGGDLLEKKAAIVKELSKTYDTRKLSAMLPDSRKSIERLKSIKKATKLPKVEDRQFLTPMVFFVDGETKTIIDDVLETAIDPGQKANKAQARAWVLVQILRKAKRS